MNKLLFTILIFFVFSNTGFASGLDMPPAWELKEHCRLEFSYDAKDSDQDSGESSSCLIMIMSFIQGVEEMARQSGAELKICEETSTSFEEYFLSENTENDNKEFGEFIWGYIIERCQK